MGGASADLNVTRIENKIRSEETVIKNCTADIERLREACKRTKNNEGYKNNIKSKQERIKMARDTIKRLKEDLKEAKKAAKAK